ALREQSEGDERVEQHACGAGIGVDPGPDLFGIGSIPDGGKDVEFKRRKNAPARHEAAEHLIKAIGQRPGFLAAAIAARNFSPCSTDIAFIAGASFHTRRSTSLPSRKCVATISDTSAGCTRR